MPLSKGFAGLRFSKAPMPSNRCPRRTVAAHTLLAHCSLPLDHSELPAAAPTSWGRDSAARLPAWAGASAVLSAGSCGAARSRRRSLLLLGPLRPFSQIGRAGLKVRFLSGAAMHVGKLMCPDNIVLTTLKNKALEVFGTPSNWTREICQEVGTVAAGLTHAEISQLQSSVIPSLTPDAILLLPTKVFSSLTPAQLMNLGPENFAVVSDQQKSSLSASQRNAFLAGQEFSNPSGSGSTRWLSMSAFTLVTLGLMVAL